MRTILALIFGAACAQETPDAQGPPNILLISMDTVRADHTSVYGHHNNTTPNLAHIAKDGVIFQQAFSVANESAYSHAALFTGRYATELAYPNYRTFALPPEASTLPEMLQAYGYQTAGFIAGGHVDGGFGFDQGFDTFSAEIGYASFFSTAPKALAWLNEEKDPEEPWFVFLHSYDAHRPYKSIGPFHHLYGNTQPSLLSEHIANSPKSSEQVYDRIYYEEEDPRFFEHVSGSKIMSLDTYRTLQSSSESIEGQPLSDEDVVHIQDHYDACLTYGDLMLGLFIADLRERGDLDNTLIIVVSDHGEDLLDHEYMNHRTALYDSVVKVPMIVSGPGFPKGETYDGLVDINDVVSTVALAAGAKLPAGSRDRPLQKVITGQAPAAEHVFFEGVLDMIGVRTKTHKLIYRGIPLDTPDYIDGLEKAELNNGHFQFFDISTDPKEQTDLLLASPETDLPIAKSLKAAMVQWRGSIPQSSYRLPSDAVKPEVMEQMQEHGYWDSETE